MSESRSTKNYPSGLSNEDIRNYITEVEGFIEGNSVANVYVERYGRLAQFGHAELQTCYVKRSYESALVTTRTLIGNTCY